MSRIEEATAVIKVREWIPTIQVEIGRNDQVLDGHEVGTIICSAA